ncbi:MAG: D-methionine transport system ATP-binding protein [Desulforhopalus sp.]
MESRQIIFVVFHLFSLIQTTGALVITIKNLRKSFGSLNVLTDINLQIGMGEIYGLVGRSGAGKSTLLRCINGLESYDDGFLNVGGVEVNSLSPKSAREFKKEIGMIFQQFSLLSRLNVYDNIALPMKCWKYKSSEIKKKVHELVEVVGLQEKLYSRPSELSGGQKQRVAIARALSMNPKILLCDEATSALDPKTAKSIISLLIEINKRLGITIVVVTHQMSVLKSSCSEISILENGRIAEKGLVEEIFLRQPQALTNLTGETDHVLPGKGHNLKILLSQEFHNKPIIIQMVRELGIEFLIVGGEFDRFRESTLGSVIINIAEVDFSKVTSYLTGHKVPWKQMIPSEYNSMASLEEEECNVE